MLPNFYQTRRLTTCSRGTRSEAGGRSAQCRILPSGREPTIIFGGRTRLGKVKRDGSQWSPTLSRTSGTMTLLEVSHATVYRMVEGESESGRASATSKPLTLEGVAQVVAGRERVLI
jgi:hypothetical protein